MKRRPRGMSDAQLLAHVLNQAVPQANGCLRWQKPNAQGYGSLHVNGEWTTVHRFVYETVKGPARGMVVDHTCHNADLSCRGGLCPHRLCINLDHLEAVERAVNVIRGRSGLFHAEKTHCPKGHPYDALNTYVNPHNGGRNCRICIAESGARYRARKAAA